MFKNNRVVKPEPKLNEKNLWSKIIHVDKWIEMSFNDKSSYKSYEKQSASIPSITPQIKAIDDFFDDNENSLYKHFPKLCIDVPELYIDVPDGVEPISDVKLKWNTVLSLLKDKLLNFFPTPNELKLFNKLPTLRSIINLVCNDLVCYLTCNDYGFYKSLREKFNDLVIEYLKRRKCSRDDLMDIFNGFFVIHQAAFYTVFDTDINEANKDFFERFLKKALMCKNLSDDDYLEIIERYEPMSKFTPKYNEFLNKFTRVVCKAMVELKPQELTDREIIDAIKIHPPGIRIIIAKNEKSLNWKTGKYNIAVVPNRNIFYSGYKIFDCRDRNEPQEYVYKNNGETDISLDSAELAYIKRCIVSCNYKQDLEHIHKVIGYHLLQVRSPLIQALLNNFGMVQSNDAITIRMCDFGRSFICSGRAMSPKFIEFCDTQMKISTPTSSVVDLQKGKKSIYVQTDLVNRCFKLPQEIISILDKCDGNEHLFIAENQIGNIILQISAVKRIYAAWIKYGFKFNIRKDFNLAFMSVNEGKGWVVFNQTNPIQQIFLLGDCGKINSELSCETLKLSEKVNMQEFNSVVFYFEKAYINYKLHYLRRIIEFGRDMKNLYLTDYYIENSFIPLLEQIIKRKEILTIRDYKNIMRFINNKVSTRFSQHAKKIQILCAQIEVHKVIKCDVGKQRFFKPQLSECSLLECYQKVTQLKDPTLGALIVFYIKRNAATILQKHMANRLNQKVSSVVDQNVFGDAVKKYLKDIGTEENAQPTVF
jgi:hypothetical protein